MIVEVAALVVKKTKIDDNDNLVYINKCKNSSSSFFLVFPSAVLI